MAVFLVLSLYLFVINVLVNNGWKKTTLSIFGFFIVLALRTPYCGVDLLGNESFNQASYYGLFDSLTRTSLNYLVHNFGDFYYEYGFVFFTKIITLFTDSFQIYIAIVALLGLIPIAIVIKKYSTDITLSWFIYGCLSLFVFSFSGLRQTLAISYTILAIDRLIEKKHWQFWFWELLAVSFHLSSIIFIVVWLIRDKRLSIRKCLIFLAIIVLLMPLQRLFLPAIFGYIFGSRYDYFDEGGAITMMFVYMALLLSSFVVKDESESSNIHLFRWLCLFAVLFQSFGFISTSALTRIAFYFIFYFSLLLPSVVSIIKERTSRQTITFVSEILLCTFFYLVNSGGYLNVVPYYFFWEKPLF